MKIRIISSPNRRKYASGGHLFPFGGHFDENGNWVNDDMPAVKLEYNHNNSIFSKNYNPLNVNKFEEAPTDWRYWIPPTQLNFKMNGIKEPTKANPYRTEPTNPDLPTSGWQTGLSYLPAIAPAISLGYQLLHKPDYGYADELDAAGNAYAEMVGNNGKVSPKFIGDDLAYNPFDRIFYANELGAQQAANRSAIMNAGNANRGATMAALLGSGYNDNVGLGKLFREGEEYNLAQRQKVADFNRGTNQYNSTLDMQAQEINARANRAKAEALLNNKYRVLGMKQGIDSQRDQNISLALTNLFNNIGGIGEDYTQKYWLNALINSGVFGTPNESMRNITASGGKLNRKKKKGLTI